MSRFSERFGISAPKVELDAREMPDSLRNGLWDIIKKNYFDDIGKDISFNSNARYSEKFCAFGERLQFSFFKASLDDMPNQPSDFLRSIRSNFYSMRYNQVYEFIEFLMESEFDEYYDVDPEPFAGQCNHVLERELCHFRLAGKQFVAITNKLELAEIDTTISSSPSSAIATHISAASALYSRNPNPDYRNSIKESISAVEAAVRFVTEKKTVGVAKPLKLIEQKFRIHPALRDGFEKIFAFTSDEQGIRHSLMDASSVSQADAKFMLVSCSAFSNYLVALKVKG